MKSLSIVLASLLALAGCAQDQLKITATSATVLSSIKSVDDELIAAWVVAGCSFPLSAIIRHPEITPALTSLCFIQDTQTMKKVLSDGKTKSQ